MLSTRRVSAALRSALIACLAVTALVPSMARAGVARSSPLPPEGGMRQAALTAAVMADIEEDGEEAAFRADMEAFEAARGQGPEAVLALRDTLRGRALDLAMPEIVKAHRQVRQQAPSRPATAAMSLDEEETILQAEAELDAASRARALAFHDDPAENNALASPAPPPQPLQFSGSATDLTVGSGCTYATIGAAIAAASPGDRLLIEGGVTFDENLSVPIALTLQGGYDGCSSGSTARTTIDGKADGPVVTVDRAIEVGLQNLNLTNGSTDLEGGGIRFARGHGTGALNLTNIHIYGNTAEWGGGLWVGPDAEVNGENVHIYGNTATAVGGGVRLYGGRITFNNSSIRGNTAPKGGGVYATRQDGHSPILNLPTGADIYDNQALTGDGLGGGVYLRQGTAWLADGSDIYANRAIDGGGACLITATLTIAGDTSQIMLNEATRDGGGVYALGSMVNVLDSAQLYSNSAQTGGGAYLDNSSLWGDKALIHYNTADRRGGGVYATNGSAFDMEVGDFACLGPRCSQLSYNTATTYFGGGAYIRDNSVAGLRNTFVESNTADYGGGVFAYDNSGVYVYNSLFAGNNAVSGTGDAVRLNLNVTMVGAGNTLAYNDAGGTDTGQAIGMVAGSSLSLHCSIIWGHADSIDTADQDVTYSNIQGGYAGTGNLNVDPLFVAPGSADYHLQAASPVIDRCAYFSEMDTDFDNEPRPIVRVRPATPYDMGADEFSTPRVGLNGGGCAYGTVTQAIAAAQDGDTLQVAAGEYFEAVDIIDKDLTIVGGYDTTCTRPGAGTTVLDASYHSGSAVDIRNNAVTLRNLRITGGDSIGGGVDVDASLDSGSQATLDNVHITGNTGTHGAGLYVGSRSVVTLTNGTRIENNVATIAGGGARVWGKLVINSWLGGITDNTAPNGGGVSVPGGVLELRPGHVGSNQATAVEGRGGGIHVFSGGVVTATHSSNVYRNSAYDGGGIYADNARVTLWAVVHSNTAANDGGGIYLNNRTALHATTTRLGDDLAGRHNEATAGAGGGIYAEDSTIEFSGRVFNNRAATQGGGVFAASSVITLTSAHVGGTADHQANDITGGVFGGGLYLSDTHALLSNTVVASNTFSSGAGWGGGIVAWGGSVVTLTNDSRVEYHHAPNVGWFGGGGAGLLVHGSTVTLENSKVLSNTADIHGGGIYMLATSTLSILNGSVIANNQALNYGGGGIAAVGEPDINISNATLRSNSASTDGGAIHLEAGTLDFTGGWTLRENMAGASGGAVAVLGEAEASFHAGDYSLVTLNRALGGHGGMVYLGNNTTTRLYATAGHEMTIYANQASENGGALYADSGGFFDVHGEVSFERNQANNGGAVYVSNGSRVWLDDHSNHRPQLWDNRADAGSGGAIYAANSPRVKCDGAALGRAGEGNRASVSGGAIYLSGSDFSSDNCIFQGNQARQHGGAIAAYTSTIDIRATYPALAAAAAPAGAERTILGPAAPTATACDPRTELCSAFVGNVADSETDNAGDGGAIFVSDSTLGMDHTVLTGNSAYRGGAIYQLGASASARVANSLIHSNSVAGALGAGIGSANGTFVLHHATLANNVGGSGFSGVASEVYNTIAWDNDGYPGFATTPGIAECNIDDGRNAGLDVDPLFVSSGAGENYRLRESSPAIDACATGLSPDLDNMPRPSGDGYDMGAYEFHAALLTVIKEGEGWVTSTPAGIDCGTVCTAEFVPGSVLTLTATAQLGWGFAGWSGAVESVENPLALTVAGDSVITATFTEDEYSLDVIIVGEGDVDIDPEQETYSYGDLLTLTATGDPGWAFASWTGDITGTAPVVTHTIVGNTVVTATFTQDEYSLDVIIVGEGDVYIDPEQDTYSYGDLVTLTATADSGWVFAGWTGALDSVENPLELTIAGDTFITAVFTEEADKKVYLPLVMASHSPTGPAVVPSFGQVFSRQGNLPRVTIR